MFRSVPTGRVRENSNKTAKKLKKLRKYHYGIIYSQNRLEKAVKERKKKLLFCSVPTQRVIENYKKIAKNNKKIKRYHYGFISGQNLFENAEKERK